MDGDQELVDQLDDLALPNRPYRVTTTAWARNPQRYVPNIFEANEEDFRKATQRVYRSPEHPTRLEVGVLPRLGE